MKARDFLVDVTISFPKGETVEEWGYVGHLFEEVNENDISTALDKIGYKIDEVIENWQKRNPTVHDCFDNSQDTEVGFICQVCASDNTEKRNKVLSLSRERGVNQRARDIVTV